MERCLNSDNYPCHGTLSRVFYGIGLIYRQRYEYSKARAMFRRSIDHSRQVAQSSKSTGAGKGKALLEYRIAKCLGLGLGWVCYTDGSLDLAATLINEARMLLADKKAAMIKAYVDVVQAQVLVSESGDQLHCLTQAIETLKEAYGIFKCHPAYRARAAYELALTSLRLSALTPEPERDTHCQNARGYINEVIEYAKRNQDREEDKRWTANALIAESRLYRALGRFPDAMKSAREVLGRSKDDRFVRIDALIELGQALMGSARDKQDDEQAGKDYRSALGCFEEALIEACENPKGQAVCHLHSARCYLRLRDGHMALEHVDKWRALRARVTNAFVHHLAKEVERELEEFKLPFTISWPRNASEIPDVGDEETRLRGWITEVALNLTGGTTDNAVKLIKKSKKQISKATFFGWRKSAGLSNGED